jgi:4-amino-4-deoxy-L-arabinose transferase-like glycosyltransferase
MHLLQPINALHKALVDPARRERSVLIALAAYLALWTIYATVSKSSQGLHPDMTELIAWSRDLSFGYLKHPPLAAWLVWLWFSVLPVAEWSYYLLAVLMPTLALWIVWRGSADYLDIEKRVVGLALLMLVPFFNFHALKFNVNTVLIPAWAATTFWFLRSYKTRSRVYAALAGIGAAACMLGKYWSVFLLAGLLVAALIDRRRALYVRSAAPWITVLAGAIVLAPHLLWLYQHDFAPFGYAVTVHGEKPFSDTLRGVLGYLAGSVGYVAIPVIIMLMVARPSRATIADMMWPGDSERRLAAAAFWGPLLLPALGALASGTELTSLWSMPAWTLLPVLLLSPPALTIAAMDTRRILAAAVAVPLLMVIASPGIAVVAQRNGPSPAAAQANLLAIEVEREWRALTAQPLRFVGGDADLAYGVIAYASERPRALTDMLPPSAAELAQGGQVIICFVEDGGCQRAAGSRAAVVTGSRTIESGITRNFFGFAGQPQRYTITIMPPLVAGRNAN